MWCEIRLTWTETTLFVEAWRHSALQIWVVRMPSGIDVRVADPAGQELRNVHVGGGWYVQPVTRGVGFGIACITRAADFEAPAFQPVGTDLQAVDADVVEFQVPPPSGGPLRLSPHFLQFLSEVRVLREQGMTATAPSTPVEAFGGRPPPTNSRSAWG